MLLLFPAYLARESTVLVRDLPGFCLLATYSAALCCYRSYGDVCAGLVSRHYGQSGPASVHGLSGVTYILGKLFWSFFKNVLGIPLWSNTLPECTPVWRYCDPPGVSSRRYSSDRVVPAGSLGTHATDPRLVRHFGIGPALALAVWREMGGPPSASAKRGAGRIRLPLLYRCTGLISILMTPGLGASADRLVEYGWPFYFVVLPWFFSASYELRGVRTAGFVAAPPAYLLAGLVCLLGSYPQLPVSRSGGIGHEWSDLCP